MGPARPVRIHVDNGSRGWGRKLAFKLCRSDPLGGLIESPRRQLCNLMHMMRCLNANAREARQRICCLQVETCGSKYKKRGAHTHAAFRLSLEGARARSQADHVRLRGIAAFGYNAAIASLGRGDECIGSWHVGIEVSRHEGVQGSAGLTVHPCRA